VLLGGSATANPRAAERRTPAGPSRREGRRLPDAWASATADASFDAFQKLSRTVATHETEDDDDHDATP
jgi:hypothetical protein